jgi:diguanylate cyclase (GGDEF)-like protein
MMLNTIVYLSILFLAAGRPEINDIILNTSAKSADHASFQFSTVFWLQIIITAAIIVLTYLFYRIKVNRLNTYKAELENIIKERTAQLEEALLQFKIANKELKKLATIDDLTKIANHRRFNEFYNLEWRRNLRNSKPLSIILIDVDYFKLFNDTYGHHAGDQCLIEVARAIQEICQRPGDLVARYGGEEFIIVLSETGLQGSQMVAEKIRSKIESLQIIHETSDVSKFVTVSIGCAAIIPKAHLDPVHLIKEADEALYKSKANGRNRVTLPIFNSEK